MLDQFRAYWVVSWLVLLFIMWLANPAPCIWRAILAGLALIRLLEVFTTGFGTTLHQQQQVRARNVVTIAIYALQVTLIFAILYHSFAMNDFTTGPRKHPTLATRPSDYLYISWSDMTSLGDSTFAPQNSMARFLEVSTTTSGVLLLGVLLAFGIDAVKDGDPSEET